MCPRAGNRTHGGERVHRGVTMADTHHTAETEEARISRLVRNLPAKARKDVARRLAGAIAVLESVVQRQQVNDPVALTLQRVVSELRTARLLIDRL